MQFTKLQSLIREREQLDLQIRAMRVREIRKYRAHSSKVVSTSEVNLFTEMETLISKVFYVKSDLDDLLDLIEAAIEEQS